MQVIRTDPEAPVVLGGRAFAVIDMDARTVLQDHYLQTLVQDLGIDKVVPMDGEGDTAYLVRLQNEIIRSGRAHELIAGYLLPEGKTNADWDPRMAQATAKHIGALNTEADRELVQRLAMEVALGFFQRALERYKRSLELFGPTTAASAQQGAMH